MTETIAPVHAVTTLSSSDNGPWTIADADDYYSVSRWSNGYFAVAADGNLHCVPDPSKPDQHIDLRALVDQLELRGVEFPVLLRFSGILRHRVRQIHEAFNKAIADHHYKGRHYAVYPIKVNQQRHVVEEITDAGRPFGFGLEAGSKPELLAVLALADNDMPIICNGFKDDEYIETVIIGHRIGRHITPVVEKATELDLILRYARKHGVEPRIGVRVKLASRGAGRWKDSAGYSSKFGLTAAETLTLLEQLKAEGMAHCLRLVHFHMGSQITDIRQVKQAVAEAARIYAELRRLGADQLDTLDVGGGLGVDYDGSQTNFESSVNYSLQEYAADVIYHVDTVCEEAGAPPPNIVTECGRALSAYHSVLVFGVLGTSRQGSETATVALNDDSPQPLFDLVETHESLSPKNLRECYHDAQNALEEALTLFRLGYLTLDQRAMAESLYWAICHRALNLARKLDYVPDEIEALRSQLTETYFCNFSVFQSMPDSWAIKQLFPIMPIHRLDTEPTREAVLADISCDSDGKVDRFIDLRDVRRSIRLHDPGSEPYYLAVFLVGAYQEILGDLHNLFGDTNAQHVGLDDNGDLIMEELVRGDTVRDVLRYVQYDPETLVKKLRIDLEASVRAGHLDPRTSGRFLRFYSQGLDGYTYLEAEAQTDEP